MALTVYDSTHGQSADQTTATYHPVLVTLKIHEAACGHSVDHVTLDYSSIDVLTVAADAAQGTAADSSLLVQHNVLKAERELGFEEDDLFFGSDQLYFGRNLDSFHVHSVESPSLSYQEPVGFAWHGHSADQATATYHPALVKIPAHEASCAQVAGAVALVHHSIAVGTAAVEAHHTQVSDPVVLLQHHVLRAARRPLFTSDTLLFGEDPVHFVMDLSTIHEHLADALSFVQHNQISAAESIHTQSADKPEYIVHYAAQLVPSNAVHDQFVDQASVVALRVTPTDAWHGQPADAALLTQHSSLAPADVLHAQASDIALIAQHNQLTAAPSDHDQSADTPVLDWYNQISIGSADHTHTVDGATTIPRYQTVAAEVVQTQASDVPTLTRHASLVVYDSVHPQVPDQVVAVPHGIGAVVVYVGKSVHSQTADSIANTQHNIIPGALYVKFSTDPLTFGSKTIYFREKNRTNHAHIVDSVVLTNHPLVSVASAGHSHVADQGVTPYWPPFFESISAPRLIRFQAAMSGPRTGPLRLGIPWRFRLATMRRILLIF